jgi:hypothetical protein
VKILNDTLILLLERNLVYYFLFSIMSDDLMKSIIVLIQNDKGDKEILMRILNDLKKDKKPFGPDKPYLRTIIEEYLPEDIHLLKSLE